MATMMPQVSSLRDWESELKDNGWPVIGIDLEDADTMTDIYSDLGIQGDSKDHRKRRVQLRAYIKKQQEGNKRQKVEDHRGFLTTVVKLEIENGKNRLPLGRVASAFGGVYDREASLLETRDGLKRLAEYRGNTALDKKDVPVLGLTATSESGKTEFLRCIFNTFCSYVHDKAEGSIADEVLDDINSSSPKEAQDFKKVLVLFASFNQTSPYSKTQESGQIVQTTVERLLRSYQGSVHMSSDGEDSWNARRFDCSSLDDVCRLFPDTAFIFCIDEVSKIKLENLEDYRELMNQFLSFSQRKIQEGQFVAIVAASLSVFDFGEVVLEGSGRSLWPIRFPTHKPKLEQQARAWIKDNTDVGTSEAESSAATTALYLDVTMNVLQSEVSMLQWQRITNMDARETRVHPLNKTYSAQPDVGADDIFLLAARRVIDKPHYEHLKLIKDKAITVTDTLHGTIDLLKHEGENALVDWNNAMGALSLPAWRILQLPVPKRGSLFQWVKNWVVVETRKLFYIYGPEEARKTWELATMALLEIRKAMFQALEEAAPSLGQVYEAVQIHHNLDEKILKKKASKMAADEAFCSLPKAKAKCKKPCFYYSNIENEAGVEGVFLGGFTALPIFFQMKLYSDATPSNINRWLHKANNRAKSLGYCDYLVQLFVTGEVDTNIENEKTTWPTNSMVVGTVALQTLFKPFGSGFIQEIVDQKNRNRR